MSGFRSIFILLLIGVGGLVEGAAPGYAQEGGRLVLARFEDATAMDVDPLGRIYVADAGRDVIFVFDRTGKRLATLGSSGTRAGEFDGPMDVDPTNGQTLLVADAGNGRIQRFSAELQYLEAVPVGPSIGTAPEQRVFDDGRDGSGVQGEGRPIAVASSESDETFVIDGRENVVVKFDEQRRSERILGEMTGAGALQAPVSIALGGSRRLYVADQKQKAVLAYDLFGTFVKRLSVPALSDVQSLKMVRGRLWIVCADRVAVWDPSSGKTQAHPVSLGRPLLDAVRQGEDLFLLTERRLIRRSGW